LQIILSCRPCTSLISFYLTIFVNGVHEILLEYALSAGSDREHTGFGAHTPDISASRVGANSRNQLLPDVLVECHRLCVDLEDLNSALKLWKREFNLAIETTGSL